MFRLHGGMFATMPDTRGWIEMGEELMKDAYGQKLHMVSRHYSYCRKEGARSVFYNFTARNFILRMITNWMSDDGFLSAFKWRFLNLYKCMAQNRPGADILEKIPSMKGKCVNRHGMEGDTCVCKGIVTDKYERGGEFYAELTSWTETLDGDIIQAVWAEVKLPSKGK